MLDRTQGDLAPAWETGRDAMTGNGSDPRQIKRSGFAMPRYLIALFPCFIALALLLRSRWALLPTLAVFTAQLVLLLAQFATWFWVA